MGREDAWLRAVRHGALYGLEAEALRKEAKILLSKAVDSLALSIEHFNRPSSRGREEVVLILLDRSFELLLKAILVERRRRIRAKGAKETIGFDKCVRKCLSDKKAKCLTEDQAISLQIINSLRDAAQHYMLDISEQQLYVHAQAGITLFKDLLESVFERKLADYLPERVLPVTTNPPRDLHKMIQAEFDDIKPLVAPGKRRGVEARAKLRALAIMDSSLKGVRSQPGEAELKHLAELIRQGKSWQDVFPGVASLRLETEGEGLTVSLRLTKKEGQAVHLVPEGTPGATVVAIKRVAELDFYSLGTKELSQKLGISMNKTVALIRHLRLQDSDEYFKEVRIGSSRFKRYSKKALDQLKRALPKVDLDQVWQQHGW